MTHCKGQKNCCKKCTMKSKRKGTGKSRDDPYDVERYYSTRRLLATKPFKSHIDAMRKAKTKQERERAKQRVKAKLRAVRAAKARKMKKKPKNKAAPKPKYGSKGNPIDLELEQKIENEIDEWRRTRRRSRW